MDRSFFPVALPFLLSGDSRRTTSITGSPELPPLQRPGDGRTQGSQNTLPVTGAESNWISGASASSGATPRIPRPALVSSSSSLSSNSKASPGSSSASGEGPRPPPGTSGSPGREEELAGLQGLRVWPRERGLEVSSSVGLSEGTRTAPRDYIKPVPRSGDSLVPLRCPVVGLGL